MFRRHGCVSLAPVSPRGEPDPGSQPDGLKKQAAQARRYRRLNELVRRQEAILLHIQWRQAEAAIAAAAARHDEAQATVNARTRSAAAHAAEQADKAAAISPLRQAEAEAAAELQRFLVAGNELDAEAARLTRAREENRRRRDQIGGDIERERTLAADADAAVGRLEDERGTLAAARQGEAEAEAAARAEVAAVRRAVNSPPSATACTVPVVPSNTTTVAATAGRPRALFPGTMQTIFTAIRSPSCQAGIINRLISGSPGTPTLCAVRKGCSQPAAKVARNASTNLPQGRAASTAASSSIFIVPSKPFVSGK